MKTVLLIEDDAIMGESLVQRFELEGFEVRWCQRLADAEALLQGRWSAVISDVRLPDGVATTWFAGVSPALRSLPWFFLTGYGSVNDAVSALRAGAREYLTKPFDIEQLVSLVQQACVVDEVESPESVLGVSAAMRRVEAMVRKIAPQRVSVLLTGESGVGKEVAAQLIHSSGDRAAKGEFIAVNCAAIPETMMEAEFFGYEKGAFSGAQRQHRGYLERADGGTLFLDEVADLPASMQAKLLRALQERCFFRLGAERTTHSGFRIISATNRDLHADMVAGRFREDLFYRLAVIRVELPPLRERPEDIRWLTERMLQQMTIEQGRPLAMSEAFLRDVLARSWPGNARELRSFLEQAVVLSESGILDAAASSPPESIHHSLSASEDASGAIRPLQAMIDQVECEHIQRALQSVGGSMTKAAKALGISRKTLWEKMRRIEASARSALKP